MTPIALTTSPIAPTASQFTRSRRPLDLPAVQWNRGSAAPSSADRQRWGTAPAARTVPRIDWSELLGVSCNRVLDGGPHALAFAAPALPPALGEQPEAGAEEE